VSDERVVASWVENPYWWYFCGIDYFVYEFPCNPSILVKWRQRVGVEGSEPMLKSRWRRNGKPFSAQPRWSGSMWIRRCEKRQWRFRPMRACIRRGKPCTTCAAL